MTKPDWERANLAELRRIDPSLWGWHLDPVRLEAARFDAYHEAIRRLKRAGVIPPKNRRPFCDALCRDSHRCRARACFNIRRWRMSCRCRRHGGHSSGPTSASGKKRALEALARGRATLAKRRAENRR